MDFVWTYRIERTFYLLSNKRGISLSCFLYICMLSKNTFSEWLLFEAKNYQQARSQFRKAFKKDFRTMVYDKGGTVPGPSDPAWNNMKGKYMITSITSEDHPWKDQQIDALVDMMTNEADPTTNFEFSPWIVREYLADRLRKEDFPNLKRDLEKYLVIKPQLRQNADQLKREYNLTGSPTDIMVLTRPVLNGILRQFTAQASSRQQEKQVKQEGAENLGYNDQMEIIKVTNGKAACYYAKNTQWCTSDEGTANSYIQGDSGQDGGPLYVIVYKKKKYQIHVETEQFMDENDGDYKPDVEFIKNMKEILSGNPKIMAQNKKLWNFVLNKYVKDVKLTDQNWKDYADILGDSTAQTFTKSLVLPDYLKIDYLDGKLKLELDEEEHVWRLKVEIEPLDMTRTLVHMASQWIDFIHQGSRIKRKYQMDARGAGTFMESDNLETYTDKERAKIKELRDKYGNEINNIHVVMTAGKFLEDVQEYYDLTYKQASDLISGFRKLARASIDAEEEDDSKLSNTVGVNLIRPWAKRAAQEVFRDFTDNETKKAQELVSNFNKNKTETPITDIKKIKRELSPSQVSKRGMMYDYLNKMAEVMNSAGWNDEAGWHDEY
jgi:hypothetical protein